MGPGVLCESVIAVLRTTSAAASLVKGMPLGVSPKSRGCGVCRYAHLLFLAAWKISAADGALLFLPSEAVYAELHANFPELVREGFDAHVWIVSPTTCMATLNTMRAILKDARMREQAGEIRKHLRMLHR